MVPTSLGLLIVLLGLSIPVGAALLLLALSLGAAFSPMPIYLAMGEVVWSASTNAILVSVPLFVLLGEILLRSGMADRLYRSMSHWLAWLPGGLMHANIGASMVFAATSGSSVATAATIGTVATPVIKTYGYGERLFLGTVAAGGTLGILIPPSINLIIYGWLTQTSVPQLYLAGFVPGIALGLIFMATILICCLIRPQWRGRAIETSWNERIASLGGLVPPAIIFLIVIGSIYAGFATPTESAALGVVVAIGLAAINRRLSVTMILEALDGTMRTSAMIMLIVAAAFFLNFVLSAIGLVGALNSFITGLGLDPMGTLVAIIIFYLILGCFMEPLPMMIVTVPIIVPVVVQAGFDPVWFGIMVVLLCETAMITPPVGVNLYVVQGVRGRGVISDVILGVLPFIGSLLVMIVLIIAAPDIVMWLPRLIGAQ
ncbi:TRAP transporter large permease [Bosea sp. (in: a-proteobacteria)]|uniref:TRAP transporter large permease n=1 Tax=Bosea sp. (in: a-proteobacteria) TaxID=1871050 RepID=UPI001ACE5B99|nr:TRAP transporter large permease [Bosea sp. (in: a-proteobacteria)]MBN9437455.1 TRAP transporter large permease [Bosea sp. (in: a-proteobacteria)]